MPWQKLSVFLPPAMLKYLCASWFFPAPSLFFKAQQQTKPDKPFAPQVKFIGRGPAGVSPTHHWVWTQGPFWGPKGPEWAIPVSHPSPPRRYFHFLTPFPRGACKGALLPGEQIYTLLVLYWFCFCCLYLWILEVPVKVRSFQLARVSNPASRIDW
jgi:hypothetical protein